MRKIISSFRLIIPSKSHLMIFTGLTIVSVITGTLYLRANFGQNIAWASSTVEVYPSPGVNTYQSNLYSVGVNDGSIWLPSYTYKFSRKSIVAWHYGNTPSVNFTTFGTSGAAQVQVSKLGSSITKIDVSPKSKNIPVTLSAGKAYLTLNQNDKVWITINGDDANPLFLFADGLKPAVPAGATYFGPGVHNIAPNSGNHYKAVSNQVIYIDGGAWVRGNIDVTGTTNVQVMGPGVLSGDLWTAESVQSLPFDDQISYAMIRGDWNGRNLASVKGITIVDSPFYNFWNGASDVYSIKILSPWHYSTDGFQAVNHVDQSFVFNGDNVFLPIWAGINQDNVTMTNSFVGNTNNAVFGGGYWGNAPTNTYTSFADNIDIKTYGNPVGWGQPTPNIFQIWVDNPTSDHGYFNQTYQNIRIEGNLTQPMAQLKNMIYPWGGPNVYDPPLGNSYNLVFRNISLAGTQPARSEIKGWDSNNVFRDVIFDNLTMNGSQVTPSNFSNFFDVNEYAQNISVTAPLDLIPPTTSITFPLNNSKVNRSSPVTIQAAAADPYGVAKVDFYVNGILKCSDIVAPFSCVWLVPALRNAVYTLDTKAYDTSNNSAISSPITVTSK